MRHKGVDERQQLRKEIEEIRQPRLKLFKVSQRLLIPFMMHVPIQHWARTLCSIPSS